MTSLPVPARRPWFSMRARFVSVPGLSAPYQERISRTRSVILLLQGHCRPPAGALRLFPTLLPLRRQDEALDCVREAFVFIGRGHFGRLRLDFRAGVAHGDREAALL